MPSVALLGASGLVGGLLAAALTERGCDLVAVARDRDATGRALREAGAGEGSAEVRIADVADPESVRRAVAGCALVLDAVAPLGPTVGTVARSAGEVGAHLVDVAAEQGAVRAVHGPLDEVARDAGVTFVSGAGLQHLIGDALAHLAATAVHDPTEVHVAYTFPGPGGVLAAASAGRRRSVAAELGVPGLALVDGELTEEHPGEARRLAWFPRPVGPAHAAAIAGGEAITVPRHVPGLTGVRTYLAVPGWRAEVLQATANAARWEPARRRLERRLTGRQSSLGPTRRAAIRWGCVAEARGAEGIARAWAYGHDPYRLTAAAAAGTAMALLAGAPQPGARAPAEVVAPAEALDRLAAATDLRWSISRPDGGGAGA